jgi:hypothetical protein
MPITAPSFRPSALAPLLAAVLALAACARGAENDRLDDALLGNGLDPALTSAIEDPILVDPNLAQQAHPNTVRPPEAPVQAQYPPPSADQLSADIATALCGSAFERGAHWAGRLPAELPLYPAARLTGAAGNDAGECRIRIVSFRTDDDWQAVLDFYRARADRAGFSSEQQQRGTDHLLGGVGPRTGSAFVLVATPLERGTEVSLVVDGAH